MSKPGLHAMFLEVFEVRADEVQLGILFVVVRELSVVVSGVVMVERFVAIWLVKVLGKFADMHFFFLLKGAQPPGERRGRDARADRGSRLASVRKESREARMRIVSSVLMMMIGVDVIYSFRR